MTPGVLLLIMLIGLLIGGLPIWPYSRSWGYAPTSLFAVVLLIWALFLLTGRV